ncbi:MAG: undecaprenyl-diphosphate phosphatase [Bacteroidales bacterium]|jgi:undecaprenyl-diphosphatase|nr:undecaprenyl-diphosphate phosphatase [Bacteroidales bacterium]
MDATQALILGLLQGITEFLPVSSSGHLEIGHAILNTQSGENLLFAVIVHLSTVLSTLVVFRKDIIVLLKDLFAFQWNESTKYISKLLLSAVPVAFMGILFKEQIEMLFNGNLIFIGSMLIITAIMLTLTSMVKYSENKLTFAKAFIIGIAQAVAVLPGISRSGSTIATGLLLKTNKEDVTRFSFIMVLIPVLGASFIDIIGTDFNSVNTIGILPLLVGFTAAFISGLLACSWMIKIVKKGKLIYFAVYCFIIGLIAIFAV